MEETGREDSLSVDPGAQKFDKPYTTIPEATYEATYSGIKTRVVTARGEPAKICCLQFKIASGEFAGRTVSFDSFMAKTNDDRFVVPNKPGHKLYEAIQKLTNGSGTLNESHRGIPVFIETENRKGKKQDPDTGEFRIYANVKSFMLKPPAPVHVKPVAAAPAAPKQAPQPARQHSAPANPQASAPMAAPAPKAAAPVSAPVADGGDTDFMKELNEISDF